MESMDLTHNKVVKGAKNMWRIMVVEDEQPILELNTRLLEKYGPFQVVASYQSSLEVLKNLPQLEVDVLLLDIEIPRMTGIELAKELVEIGIDVPVVFSTAYREYAVEAFRVQALDYILKPMTPKIVKQLDERLKKYYGLQPKKSFENMLLVQLYGSSFVKKGDQVVKWPTRVTEELFYYFLLNDGKICSKWRLIDDIWTNVDEKRAISNLYNTIYRMRQLFSELNVPIVIERINDGYEMKTNDSIKIEERENENDLLLEAKGYLWSYGMELN